MNFSFSKPPFSRDVLVRARKIQQLKKLSVVIATPVLVLELYEHAKQPYLYAFYLASFMVLVFAWLILQLLYREDATLSDVPAMDPYTIRLKVFCKSSSLCRTYYTAMSTQHRPVIMGEYTLMEKEFIRSTAIKEQDLKTGNASLFKRASSVTSTTLV